MCKVNWNTEELRKLFINKYGDTLLPRLNEYISALYWKQWRSYYHSDKSKELWEELFKQNKISVSEEPFQKTMDSATAEVEAMVQALHSMGDILAQVVNLTIFGSAGLSEDEVTLDRVIKKISEENIASNVLQLLLVFRDSNEYQHIAAFCNTIKHRKLLDIDYHTHIDYTNRGKIEEGVRFREFTYKGKNFPVTWSHTIYEEYRVKIYNLLCDVGIGINEYFIRC